MPSFGRSHVHTRGHLHPPPPPPPTPARSLSQLFSCVSCDTVWAVRSPRQNELQGMPVSFYEVPDFYPLATATGVTKHVLVVDPWGANHGYALFRVATPTMAPWCRVGLPKISSNQDVFVAMFHGTPQGILAAVNHTVLGQHLHVHQRTRLGLGLGWGGVGVQVPRAQR